MTLLYASITLVLALTSVPVVLAAASREQGWRIVDRAWQLIATVPNLLAGSLGRWKSKVLSHSRSALQETNVQNLGQALAVLASVFVALVGLPALIINSISTLAGLQGSKEFIVEILSGMNVTPITLMGVEMGMACFYLPALLLDALGITHIFYVFLYVSSSDWPKWRRVATRVLIGLLALAGTVGAGYVLYETGTLRERVVETSGSESLLESSGLSSGDNSSSQAPSSQATPDQAAPDQAAPDKATSGPSGRTDQRWATHVSATWPSLLGFLAGVFAFANSIPAMAFLTAGAFALLWLLLVPVRALTYAVAALLARSRSLMLSLFNFTLNLRGKPPVGAVRGSALKDENSGLQARSGKHVSPKKKTDEEAEDKGADSEGAGPGETSRSQASRSGTSRDETSRDGDARDSTTSSSDEDTPSEPTHSKNTSPSGKEPLSGRIFQPWWFKNPPSQRPSSPDDAEKEPGRFYAALNQAAKASRARKASQRACILELRLKENGGADFLARHTLPFGESEENT